MIVFLIEKDNSIVNHLEYITENRKAKFKRINVESFPEDNIYLKVANSSTSITNLIDTPDITGIFCRYMLPVSENLSKSIPEEFRRFTTSESRDFLLGSILSCLREKQDARWINPVMASYASRIKINQLKIAKEVGWVVPETIISNNKKVLIDFWREKNGQVITKAIHSGWLSKIGDKNKVIFTSVVTEKHLEKISDINYPPLLFQEKIDKNKELRVVVIGKKYFSCSLGKSINIDWRVDNVAIDNSEIFNLPCDVEKKSIEVVKNMGLSFGVLDVILDKSGNFYFLEVNEQGEWLWMDEKLDLPIGDSIIDYLEGKNI